MRELCSLKNLVPGSVVELPEQCQKDRGNRELEGVERNLDALLLSVTDFNLRILRENRR
jgi:hypothetical protein